MWHLEGGDKYDDMTAYYDATLDDQPDREKPETSVDERASER